jgi:hypothetical protein
MIKQPETFSEHRWNEMDHDLIDQRGLETLLINAGTKRLTFLSYVRLHDDQLNGLRHRSLRPHIPDQLIFFLQLPAEELHFGFLNRANAEASFY